MELPKMTHEEELDLERFANYMVELIERHAHVVDKKLMQEKLNKLQSEGAEKSASSVVLRINESYNIIKGFVVVPKRKALMMKGLTT